MRIGTKDGGEAKAEPGAALRRDSREGAIPGLSRQRSLNRFDARWQLPPCCPAMGLRGSRREYARPGGCLLRELYGYSSVAAPSNSTDSSPSPLSDWTVCLESAKYTIQRADK
jgi:hypothetical protein